MQLGMVGLGKMGNYMTQRLIEGGHKVVAYDRDPQAVQRTVADGAITIRGEKRANRDEKDKNYRLVERSYGGFARTLDLPEGVNLDAIKATIDKGILKVTVPKPAPAQAKKIEVKPAA